MGLTISKTNLLLCVYNCHICRYSRTSIGCPTCLWTPITYSWISAEISRKQRFLWLDSSLPAGVKRAVNWGSDWKEAGVSILKASTFLPSKRSLMKKWETAWYAHTTKLMRGDLLRSVPSPKWVAKIKLICTAGSCCWFEMIYNHHLQYW